MLDADPKAIQQINFTANLDRAGNTTMFFIIEEAKETVLDFSQETLKVCKYNFIEWFNFYQYKMTQYNSLNVKLSNSQFWLKSAIEYGTEVVLRFSSNMIGDPVKSIVHISCY